jgi:hypothetical protein
MLVIKRLEHLIALQARYRATMTHFHIDVPHSDAEWQEHIRIGERLGVINLEVIELLNRSAPL